MGVVQEYYGSICVGQTDLVTVTGVERNAFGAVVMQVKGEIAQSPWQFVAIVLAVLLGIFLLLLIWSTWSGGATESGAKIGERGTEGCWIGLN